MDTTRARLCFGATALLVVVGIVIQVPVAVNAKHGFFRGAAAGLNVFAFFTIQSNLLVGATCLLLAWRLDLSSTVFNVFRLIGVVAAVLCWAACVGLPTAGAAAKSCKYAGRYKAKIGLSVLERLQGFEPTGVFEIKRRGPMRRATLPSGAQMALF